MPEYIYLINRINAEGEEKTVAACRTQETADEYRDMLDTMQELSSLGWFYEVEPLKISG